jgi:integrase
VQDVPIGGVVEVCLFAKTRIGEACGLRWRDVDPFGETLTVAQQIVDRRKHDATITYSRARKALEKLTEAAGLGASGAAHRLKHTSAMISVVAGTPIPVLQRALRHRNVQTTMVHAGHPDEALAREDARAGGRRLRGEPTGTPEGARMARSRPNAEN